MKRLIVFLLFIALGCASGGTSLLRDPFMAKAKVFDKRWAGKEFTPIYRMCYSQYFNDLFLNCQPLVPQDSPEGFSRSLEADPYWECAGKAFDAFETCVEGGR